MPDRTQYQFQNAQYGKGRLVLAVLQQYARDHNPGYAQLKQAFPDSLQGGQFVIIEAAELVEKNAAGRDTRTRVFDSEDEVIITADAKTVLVSNQWGAGNIDDFIAQARHLGYTIETVERGMNALGQQFELYLKNPATDWIERYRRVCQQLREYRGKAEQDYDDELLKLIWLKPANGISSVRPGHMSNLEFEALRSELPRITSQIVEDPSPQTLDAVMRWAQQAKQTGKFKSIKKGVIHRVFAAASPESCSTILRETLLRRFIKRINDLYELNMNEEGNWAALNQSLLQVIKSQGFEREDVYVLNTFVWRLCKSLMGIDDAALTADADSDSVSQGCCNLIYFGPPGTGKTYKLQQLLRDKYTETQALADDTAWLSTQIEALNWFEVVTLVLLEAEGSLKVRDILVHEYFQLKAQLNDRDQNLAQSAWSVLQSHTVADSSTVKAGRRIEPFIFDKTEDSRWFIDPRQAELLEEMKALQQHLKAGPNLDESIQRYEFVTFHQSFGYEEFIEGLRPKTDADGNIEYRVEAGVFKRLCRRAQADPDNQYALVIDEINRGNISKIFGELITLIELDKRAGCENELSLTLPYSGSSFSVPANLDIIGTMNTADRSLTHIDVALRRRFQFQELRTDYKQVKDDIDGINLRWMLYAMNRRIELLLDREHTLGHALVMHCQNFDDLQSLFRSNILPLLEEYFFDNWDKIDQVLNANGFVREQQDAYSIWLGNSNDYALKASRFDFEAMQNPDAYKAIYKGVDAAQFAALG